MFCKKFQMQDDSQYIVPTAALLSQVKNYASLKFAVSEIATILLLDPEQLRRQITSPADPFHQAYESGKLESQVKYREKIRVKAEEGQTWAITLLEKWEKKQLEEELGGHA